MEFERICIRLSVTRGRGLLDAFASVLTGALNHAAETMGKVINTRAVIDAKDTRLYLV